MGIASDLSALKTKSDTLTNNKVSRFAYTDTAYTNDDADGVTIYDVNQAQNIPVGTPAVMKVNQTVVDKGYRARASSLTRMLLNHFLGRISYNLNKVNDWFNTLLVNLSDSLGTANGLATLDENSVVTQEVRVSESLLMAVFARFLGKYVEPVSIPVNLGTTIGTQTSKAFKDVFVACGDSNNKKAYWSDDDVNFTVCTGLPDVEFTRIRCSKSICIITNNNGDIYWSENGKHFTSCTFQDEAPASFGDTNVYYKGNMWFLSLGGAKKTYWSEEGKVWSETTGLPADGYIYSDTVDSDNGGVAYSSGLWICAISATSASNKGFYWSEDGKAWTTTDSTHVVAGWFLHENGIWVSLSNDGKPYWSTDGKIWTAGIYSAPSGGNPFIGDYLSYGNGIWVIGMYNEGVYWSEDGKNWTQSLLGAQSLYNSGFMPIYRNGIWVVGANAGLYYSFDGKVWNISSITTGDYTSRVIAYFNGLWLVKDYISEDGITWKSNGTNKSFQNIGRSAIYFFYYSSGTYYYYVSNVKQLIKLGWIDLGFTPLSFEV